MLKVEQFRYATDNLGYLVFGKKKALAVDGGAVDEILTFLEDRELELVFIANTHAHFDHLLGNDDLARYSRAGILGGDDLRKSGELVLEGETIRVYPTPGHTDDALCFHAGLFLLSGDTLFNGTVGNCFSGNLRSFYLSVKKLMALPPQTLVLAGHDYLRDAVAFAKRLEPGNRDIDAYLERYEPAFVCSRMEDELRVNPYLRFNDERIVAVLKERGLPAETELDRWESLMSIE